MPVKKIRIAELAKELGLTNKEALDLSKTMGIDVKGVSSSMEEAQADRVRRKAVKDGLKRDVQPEEEKPAKKAAAKKAAVKKVDAEDGSTPAPAKKAAAKKTTRKPNAAFMKPLTPSAVLAAVVGANPLPRTDVTKKIWDYIKKHKLQDSVNRRNINADDKLKAVFGGKKTVSMFEMTKLISGHLK